MSDNLLFIKSAELGFGSKSLFTNVDFQISAGDKICLVGRNGSGKSSFLKSLSGQYELDKGEIYKKPGIKIGYLGQEIVHNLSGTVYEYVTDGLDDKEEKLYIVDMVLDNLNLKGNAKIDKLSGGKLRRAFLAKVLINDPDILLLDEPTNHLDIASIEWLEKFLIHFKGAFLCISHDRRFLSNISKKTIWIDRGNFRVNTKGFSHFDEWEEEVYKQEELDLARLEKKVEAENHWLSRGVTARRKRNQQRLKEVFALRDKFKESKNNLSNFNAKIDFATTNISKQSQMVIEAHNLSFCYVDAIPPRTMIKNFDIRILRGEKIAVVGKNGAGKTTFLKLIVGELKPTGGEVIIGKDLKISYFDQRRESLDINKTPKELLCPDGGDHIKVADQARHYISYLNDFLFDKHDAHAKISSFSGGQINRLLLAKIFADPGDLLILDEPTNDLDFESLEVLSEAIINYPGTCLIVTHDRDFIDKMATRTLIFNSNAKIEDHIGGYTQYKSENQDNKPKAKQNIPDKKEEKFSPNNKPGKLSYKLQRELEELPGKIEKLTKTISEINTKLNDGDLYSKNPDKFFELTKELSNLQSELEMAEYRWLELEEMKK